jgi:hypothetical protein
MRHKWQNDKCVKCGLERDWVLAGKFKYPFYKRSNQLYGDKRPECIDIKKENDKTID